MVTTKNSLLFSVLPPHAHTHSHTPNTVVFRKVLQCIHLCSDIMTVCVCVCICAITCNNSFKILLYLSSIDHIM